MQVTELTAEGLKREYKVVVPASEIETRVTERLEELKQKIRMPGFRPGKVPVSLLKKQYGRSVMGEVLEQAVNQGSQQAISEHELRPALRPKIEVTAFDEGADLEFTMALEVLPQVPAVDLRAISLTRPVAEVSEETVAKSLENFVQRFQEYEPLAEPRPAQSGDQVVIDFAGTIEGEPFEGGSGQDLELVLGSGRMLPGFEDQLTGASAGDEVTVEVSFPTEFPNPALAGKPAHFVVQVKEVRQPKPLVIDDELAKRVGFDDLAAMQTLFRDSIKREYERVSRARAKRSLLDHLAETYPFTVPAGMVDLEFDAIWKQIKEEIERSGNDTGKSEEELASEYRGIAERRVRLGLILSDVGQTNELKVEQHELNAAIMEQARRYPGQEQKVLEFFKSNPTAVEQLRAPIYEDKVVDFILQMATIEDQVVSPEELMRDPDEEHDHDHAHHHHHDHDHDHDHEHPAPAGGAQA
jgi:trigger factor